MQVMKTLAATVAAVALAATACGSTATAAPAPAPAPVTVTSVDGWSAMTLSDGRKVFDATDAPSEITWSSCMTTFMTDKARERLVGARIVEATESATNGTPPAGYTPAQITYDFPAGPFEVERPWTSVQEQSQVDANTACDPPETVDPAPVEDPAADATPAPRTDVHVHVRRHHNLRDGALTGGYCARKWWC